MSDTYLGIDHLGIAVNDLQAAVDTYRDVLGLTVTAQETLSERGIEVCFVDTGIGGTLELLGPLADDSEISAFLSRRGPGVHHVCLRVSDIEARVRAMRAAGARIVTSERTDALGIAPGAHNTRVAFVHPKSTHGLLIELVQHPEPDA